VNLLATRKREHSRKRDEQYEILRPERCSIPELFARGDAQRLGDLGNQADDGYRPDVEDVYAHSRARMVAPGDFFHTSIRTVPQ